MWSLIGLIALAFLFYWEEDWRGARAWAQAKAEIEAQGESLDPSKFIPPPVPDAENFGALPIFRVEPAPIPDFPREAEPSALNKALESVLLHIPTSKDDASETDSLPYLGKWQKGESPDLPAIQKQLEEFCHRQLPSVQIPANAKLADIFGLICPVLADLRAADATHPACRFEHDYATQPPWGMPLGPTTAQIKLARVLSYEERLALLGDQPDLAIDDFKVAWKIDSGLRKEPLLISGVVSVGVVAIQLGVINEGLAKHVWNDQQLATLDDDLGKIDYLTESQFSIRGDVAVFMIPNMDYSMAYRSVWMKAILMKGTIFEHEATWSDYLSQGILWLIPDGWIDDCKADSVRFHLLGTVKMVDPVSRRVFPEKEKNTLGIIEDSGSTMWWHYYLMSFLRPELNNVRKFAYEQAQIDETRIACRLERYRLVHGTYPATLDALVPAYGSDLPHDIMNGEAYHYRLNQNETFVLYSVGWNQKDDGGQPGPYPYRTSDDPDWIWTNYPDLKKTK